MKKLLSIIACLALIIVSLPLAASNVFAATSGYYTYTVSNGKATITSVSNTIRGDVTIPSTLGGYPVTSIGEGAFYYRFVSSVTIPDSVTNIGNNAFAWCIELESVTIGNGVTNIGDGAFYYCDYLTSVTIGNSVTSIGDGAFYDCTSLTSIVIPDSVTSIGYETFYDCTSLTSVTIGDGVTSIGSSAFENCYSLTGVYITDIVAWCKNSSLCFCR